MIGQVTASASSVANVVNYTQGDIALSASGSIVGADGAAFIQAPFVSLTAEYGVIGSIASPLTVDTGYTSDSADRLFGDPSQNAIYAINPYYGLKAIAGGDIGIAEAAWSGNAPGTMLVDTVVSTGGNVLLTAPGQILDNDPAQKPNAFVISQLENYWQSLGLTSGTANQKQQTATVVSFENSVTQSYDQYWRIRRIQADGGAAYDPNYVYTLAPGSARTRRSTRNIRPRSRPPIRGYRRPTSPIRRPRDVQTFEQSQTSLYHSLNAEVGDLTASYQPTYRYAATQTRIDTLLHGSTWTNEELAFQLSPASSRPSPEPTRSSRRRTFRASTSRSTPMPASASQSLSRARRVRASSFRRHDGPSTDDRRTGRARGGGGFRPRPQRAARGSDVVADPALYARSRR